MKLSTVHPTAIIDPKADVHKTAKVGPYSVIDAGVAVGADCVIGPHVHLVGNTTIGRGNCFHTGAVIGDEPQDLKYTGEPTRLRIGDHNNFREHVTIHRSNTPDEDTIIGNHNFFMAHSHVGHNSIIGNHNTFANGTLIAGHVEIADRTLISGNCLVHQFVRIGTLALMQGGAAISKDLPPYTIAANGLNGIRGLNTIGIRRAGFNSERCLDLKRYYRLLFLEGNNLLAEAKALLKEATSEPVSELLEFIIGSKRGVCRHADRKQAAD